MPQSKDQQFNITVSGDSPLTAAEIKAALREAAIKHGIVSGYHHTTPSIGRLLAVLVNHHKFDDFVAEAMKESAQD
jgi:hypothetical protein